MSIRVSILDGYGHIFRVEDLKTLREQFHICGILSGVLAHFPQQNVFLGLPLVLMPEDTVYLLEKKAITLTGPTQEAAEVKEYLKPDGCAYLLYKYLVDQGLYLMPGLRFGCQFMAYPGDPLRYHAHYNANGYEYDQDIPLIDLVGGGRLVTAVKKCLIIGAQDTERYRVFSIEWSAFG